jgi:3-hydroxyacyl-[acyl-carrier-protein] dehydratase
MAEDTQTEQIRTEQIQPEQIQPEQIRMDQIMEMLPHRYPMLLVDRILEIEPDRRIVALKNVSVNEAFFQGHFQNRPVMPGVLIFEAMAQAGACLVFHRRENRGRLAFLAGVDHARFKRPATPGDQLILEIHVLHLRKNFGKCAAKALIDGEIACEAELMFALE